MKKKILMKHILAALTMAAMVPIGQAWAEEIPPEWNPTVQENKLIIQNATGTVMSNYTYQDKPLSEFETVEIHFNALGPGIRPVGVYSARYDLKNTNVIVYTKGNASNNDALHFTNHYPHFNAKSLTIYADAKGSDAVNLSRDITTNTSVNISGDLTAIVKDGNGIRANASIQGNYLASITVGGKTDITIQADAGNLLSAAISGAAINPTAVWAGSDANSTTADQKALGRGEINLNGKTTITLNGNGLSGDGLGAFLGNGQVYGISAGKNGSIQVNDVEITANGSYSYGISASDVNITYNSDNTENRYGSIVTLNGDTNVITMRGDNSYAIYAEGVDTKGNSNTVQSGKDGIGSFEITGDIAAENGGLIDLHATDTNKTNSLTGDLTADGAGSSASLGGYSVAMKGDAENTVTASATNGGTVSLTADHDVSLTGNLTADGKADDGTASSASLEGNTITMTGNASATAGGMVDLESTYGNTVTASDTIVSNGNGNVVSALYADNGTVNLTGASNAISSNYTITGDKDKERTLWVRNKGTINVSGQTSIAASNVGDNETTTEDGEITDNNRGIAIAAGMDTITDTDTNYNMPDPERSQVNIGYSGSSSVTGDIAAGYGGKITISANQVRALTNGEESEPSLHLTGNALAANGGIVNIDLGKGGSFTGRADDYGDAGSGESSGHGTTFFNPAFSNEIKHGGAVNFTMGEGSTWKVKGQSWITSIDTRDAAKTEEIFQAEDPIGAMKNMATIDLVSANTDRNTYAHALTVYKMDGDAVFNMSLDGDRNVSDMLYMKKADGNYIINVVDPVTLDDMYAKRENGELFNGLRFATVGAGSDVTFRAVTVDQGVLNVEYEVGTDSYDGNDENGEYNSTAEDGTSGNSEKPGNAMVDGFFESDKEPVGSSDNTASSADYMTLSETGTEEDSGTDTQTDAVNYKLMGRADEQISSAGKAIVAMSKVNYSNAVYMDRLNKRVGEARYLDGDDGLWVRLRHDRIGKEDAFRSMNTMMELGYDWKAKGQKDGEHRQGVVFDYMRGTADYTNVMGDGDVRRAGVWLYDTWLGDKGHYTDYVVKYGHLSNDFDIYAPTTADKISGDYNNDVWSVSAEYGRKKDIGSDWYFEPQAQLQYAYVTSADYTTSQGTKVKLDGIDSLIGRAGFRLGRDINEGNTVYFKADVLHEFLGDQSIRAVDKTGVLSTTYENEGTWYDVGFGFSHRMGKDSYMFLDLEHSFGNDNDETYQINIGLSKAF